MKKILIYIILFITTFSYILNVNAQENGPYTGYIQRFGQWPDGSGFNAAYIGIGKGGFVYKDLLSFDNNLIEANQGIYLYFNLSSVTGSIYTADVGAQVTSTFYITMGGNINVGDYQRRDNNINMSLGTGVNNVTIIKTSLIENIIAAPGYTPKPVYKIIVKWTPIDVLDTVPNATSISSPSWLLIGGTGSTSQGFSIHGVDPNIYYDNPNMGMYVPPSTVEPLEQQSFLNTVISLPGNILNWFLALPGNIWDVIRTGFSWIVDGISDLAGNIVSALINALGTTFPKTETAFNNLLNKYSNPDMPILNIISAPINLYNSITTNNTVTLNIPIYNQNVTLPNGQVYYSSLIGPFYNTILSITFMFTSWFVGLNYLNWVKNFQNPKDDRLEVMDL